MRNGRGGCGGCATHFCLGGRGVEVVGGMRIACSLRLCEGICGSN